jgi:hypothetical protein
MNSATTLMASHNTEGVGGEDHRGYGLVRLGIDGNTGGVTARELQGCAVSRFGRVTLGAEGRMLQGARLCTMDSSNPRLCHVMCC